MVYVRPEATFISNETGQIKAHKVVTQENIQL